MESSSIVDETITLISKEGTEIPIKKKIGNRSVFIRGFIDEGAEHVPLPQITEKTIRKVIIYLEYLEGGNASPEIERPLRSNDISDVVSDWYAEFITKDIADEEV